MLWSPPDTETRKIEFLIDAPPSQIGEQYIMDNFPLVILDEYGSPTLEGISNIQIGVPYGKGEKNLLDQVVLAGNPQAIAHMFNEDILINNEYKCCRDYIVEKLTTKHGKYKSTFKKSELQQCETTRDFLAFCKRYDIKMLVFDINGRVIAFNYVKQNSRKHYPSIVYLQYNQHIYPIKNKYINEDINYLRKNSLPDKFITKSQSQIHNIALDLIRQGHQPYNIRMFGNKISAFTHNGAYYNSNQTLKRSMEILEKFGLKDKARYNTTIINLNKIICKANGLNKLDSFMPQSRRYIKSAFNYVNPCFTPTEQEDEFGGYTIPLDKCICMDKVKAYSYELQELDYNIICDIKYAIINTNPEQDIVAHYLYEVEPEQSSIILPNNNLYWGECLIFAKKEGLNFHIIKSYSTSKTNYNKYSSVVRDIYQYAEPDEAKLITNAMIGQMESFSEMSYPLITEKIGNREEVFSEAGHHKYLGKCEEYCPLDDTIETNVKSFLTGRETDTFSTIWDDWRKNNWYKDDDIWVLRNKAEKPVFTIKNKKPIAIQIKDGSRMRLYNLMKSLKLDQSCVAYIKTDCVAFIPQPKTKTKIKKLMSKYNGLAGYREIAITEKDTQTYYPRYNRIIRPIETINNVNKCGICYAGAGKSYRIMNEIIPKLVAKEKTYIVFSSQHSALRDYRMGGFNCSVLACYSFGNKPDQIPEEEYIIIDEFGMLEERYLDFIYKLTLLGKKVIAFGDYGQLLPVKKNPNFLNQESSGKEWLELMFGDRREQLLTNYRNNFTPQYYESLKSASKEYALQELAKHKTEWDKAGAIITYTNLNRHKYNKMKCDKLGLPYKAKELTYIKDSEVITYHKLHFDPENLPIGALIICNTNKFRKYNLYNKYLLIVAGETDTEVILKIKDSEDIVMITKKEFMSGCPEDTKKKAFNFGYARTLYSIQGESIEGGVFYPEDEGELRFITPRAIYTLISRIKEPLKKPATQQKITEYL